MIRVRAPSSEFALLLFLSIFVLLMPLHIAAAYEFSFCFLKFFIPFSFFDTICKFTLRLAADVTIVL